MPESLDMYRITAAPFGPPELRCAACRTRVDIADGSLRDLVVAAEQHDQECPPKLRRAEKLRREAAHITECAAQLEAEHAAEAELAAAEAAAAIVDLDELLASAAELPPPVTPAPPFAPNYHPKGPTE